MLLFHEVFCSVLDPIHFNAEPDPWITDSGYSRILNKKSDFLKKNYILVILVFVCEFIMNYFLAPGSGSTFPEADPDPAK